MVVYGAYCLTPLSTTFSDISWRSLLLKYMKSVVSLSIVFVLSREVYSSVYLLVGVLLSIQRTIGTGF